VHEDLINDLQSATERRDAEELAARVVSALTSVEGRARLELAERMKLPVSARVLGRHAGPVLRILIEDEPMRPFFADGAAHLWLELDIDDALPAALGIASDVNAMTLMSLASNVEGDERWELLGPRLANDPFFIEVLSRVGAPLVHDDDRYVDAATAHLSSNPVAAVRLIGRVASARACDELIGVIERAEENDEHVTEAFTALETLQPDAAAVVAVLRSPIGRTLVAVGSWRITPLVMRHRAEIETMLREALDTELLASLARALQPQPPRRRQGIIG
jgi:hypothetical protein